MASLLERMNITTSSAGPIRNKNGQSSRPSTPYARPTPTPKGNIEDKWSHDLFDDSLSSRMNVKPTAPRVNINAVGVHKALSEATGIPSSQLNIKGASQTFANVVEVRGLVEGTTPDDVAAIFKRCGHVLSSKKHPGGNELCIRLTFKEPLAAESAVKKFNNQPADGKILSVQLVGTSTAGNSLVGRLGKDGLGVVRQEGSVDVLMDAEPEGGSKMRSDSLINSERAQVLTRPPGTDPKDYAPVSSRGGGKRGNGRGRGGRRKRGGLGSRMDLD